MLPAYVWLMWHENQQFLLKQEHQPQCGRAPLKLRSYTLLVLSQQGP